MLIQPILEFKGVRIELNVEEAMKIAEGKADGATRVQAEVAMIVGVHSKHLPAPDGIEATPLLRPPLAPKPDGKKSYGRQYPQGQPGEQFTCDVCGKRYPPQENGRRRLGLDAAHIFSRRLKSVRHDLDNGVSLCTGCHLSWAHSRPLEFREWVRAWMGAERYHQLEQRAVRLEV